MAAQRRANPRPLALRWRRWARYPTLLFCLALAMLGETETSVLVKRGMHPAPEGFQSNFRHRGPGQTQDYLDVAPELSKLRSGQPDSGIGPLDRRDQGSTPRSAGSPRQSAQVSGRELGSQERAHGGGTVGAVRHAAAKV
jgi:hypothetical protein